MAQPFVENVRRTARDAWGATGSAASDARVGVLGAVERAAQLYRTAKQLGLDDVLLRVGLQRKVSPSGYFGAFGAGMLVGAGAGVLLAPRSGVETRRILVERLTALATGRTDAVAGPPDIKVETRSGPTVKGVPTSQRVAIDEPSVQRERRSDASASRDGDRN